jgi:long-chain fatty acid transport protein
VGWQATENIAFDVAYTHIFVDDSPINVATSTGNRLSGEFKSNVDIVAVTARYTF